MVRSRGGRFTRRSTRRRREFSRGSPVRRRILLGFAPPLLMRDTVRHAQRPYALAQVVVQPADARRRRPGLEQLPARDRPRRRRPDLPPRHLARDDPLRRGHRREGPPDARRARRAALACLARFRERLSGLHPSAVRAVATNTFRVASNAADFLPQAEAALGFPIDIIGGHEEARLIYLGVAHVLPPSPEPRLVIDIGGGSTEFIIGRGMTPERLESLKLGCVSMSQRFFPERRAARRRRSPRRRRTRAPRSRPSRANSAPNTGAKRIASSGTALALAAILEENGLSDGGITPEGLARLRKRMVGAGQRLAARTSKASSPSACRCWPAASRSWPRPSPSSTSRASTRSAARCASASCTTFSAAPSSATAAPSTVETLLRALSHRPRARGARRGDGQGALSQSVAGRRMPTPRSASNGRRCCTRSATRSRTSASTSTARTSSRTPTCRASPRRSSASSRCSCSAAAAACRRWTELLADHRPRRRRSSRCGSPCSSITRAARSTRRASRSRSAARSASAIAKRWLKAHPLTSHLLDVEREEWKALGHPWQAVTK